MEACHKEGVTRGVSGAMAGSFRVKVDPWPKVLATCDPRVSAGAFVRGTAGAVTPIVEPEPAAAVGCPAGFELTRSRLALS